MNNRIDTGSISFRFALVGALTLGSLIPLGLVSCVASDRSSHYEQAVLAVQDRTPFKIEAVDFLTRLYP